MEFANEDSVDEGGHIEQSLCSRDELLGKIVLLWNQENCQQSRSLQSAARSDADP